MSIYDLGKNDVSEGMQAAKDKLSSKDAQIAAQQGQLMKKAAELDELKQTLNDALQKLTSETSRVLQLETSLEKATSDLQNTSLVAQNTSSALVSTEEKLRAKVLEAKELENTLVSLSHNSDSHQSRLIKVEQEKHKLEARVKELEAASRATVILPVTPRTPARTRSSSLSNLRITHLENDLSDLRATLTSRDSELRTTQSKLEVVQRDAINTNNEKMAVEARLRKQTKEMEEAIAERDEELRYLKEQGGTGSLEREEELLKRIDEDDAKIEALERIIGDAHDMPVLKERLRRCEERLRSESSRFGELEAANIELIQEKEEALDELEHTRARVGELEAQNRSILSEFQGLKSQSTSGPDEETVANIARLLDAIERLRGERDALRRDMEFLDMESKFTIAALEAKVASTSSFVQPDVPIIQITPSDDPSMQTEIRRLQGLLLSCGIVIDRLETCRSELEQRYNSAHSAYEQKANGLTFAEARLHETESRLETTIQLLEETTTHRNDILSRLSTVDSEWQSKLKDTNAEQQESRNTVEHLSAQLIEISKNFDDVVSERDSLNVQVTNLNTEINAARQELSAAESRYTELQFHQLSDMTSTQATKALRTQIEALEGRVLRRTEQIGIHQHDVRRLETNLKLQEERLTEMTVEMEMVLAQKDAMVEDCADAREQRDEAISKVERLEEEVERLENELEVRGKEQEAIIEIMFLNSARTKEKMGMEAGRIEEMRVRTQSLLAERDSTLSSVHSLNEALEDTKRRLQASENEAKRVAEELALSQADLTRSLMSTQDLDQVKTDLSGRVRELELQLESHVTKASSLSSQLDSLEKESSNAIDQHTTTISKLESELEATRSSLSSKEAQHREAVDELRRQLVQKERLLANNDLEGELVTLKMKHVEEIGELQSRLVKITTALDELQARHNAAQLEHKQSLNDSAQSKADVEQQLRETMQELSRVKELKEILETTTQQQTEEVRRLEERITAFSSDLERIQEEKEEAGSALQHTVAELAKTREEYEDLLKEAENKLSDIRNRLEEESTAMSRSRDQTSELQKKLEQEVQGRAQDRSSYERDLQSANDLHEQAELRVEELGGQVSTLEAHVLDLDTELRAIQQEKKTTQNDMTALEANFQRSISMNRHLESKIRESERTIASLNMELENVNNHLAKVEKACNAAEVNLSLQNAQHKREVSRLQRELELESSKARPELEKVVSELEDRNNEMEELLRKKCEEIEENDDVKLGLMKDNKSLKNKVESLTRKVNNLQTKLTAAKAAIPTASPVEQRIASVSSASSIASSATSPMASSSSLATSAMSVPSAMSRPRSNTMVGPPSGTSFRSNSAVSPAVPERLNRVVSGPSALPRPKTPERRTFMTPVFKAMSPKKDKARADHDPSPITHSKKRRAPDDFEGYEVPPQAFTPESLPEDDQATPKVRRVLSSIQSGFTPSRNQNRPTIPMPSPKRVNPVFTKSPAASTPNLTNNTFLSAPAAGPPLDGKKRGWLGKIRGASAATQREFP